MPGFLGPFSADIPLHIQQAGNEPAFKNINRWLSRADVQTIKATDVYSTLQFLLHPQCALSLSGLLVDYEGIDTSAEFIYRIDPVHFKAESDHAILLGSNLLKPTEDEAVALIEAFNQHFAEDNLSLIFSAADRWYLQTRKELSLDLKTIDECLGRDIKHFMPQGEDALWWRRILNEAQMLFFQHEVNVQREQNLQLSINGLWLWDKTFTPGASEVKINTVFADDTLSMMFAECADVSHDSVDAFWAFDKPTANSLLFIDTFYDAASYGDIDAWLDALDSFANDEFVQLNTALIRGKCTDIFIYPCDGRVFHINRWKIARLWKSKKNITQLFAEPN